MRRRITDSIASHFVSRALTLVIAGLCWAAPQNSFAKVAPATKQSADAELKALQVREESARQDMSRWLRETAARDEHLADKPTHVLSLRMEHRIQAVSAAYAEFIARHPDQGNVAVLADAFRADLNEDLEAVRHWEDDRFAEPESPAPWNELAHFLAHNGRTVDAFVCFERSLSLSPRAAVYFFDYATALLLYRSEAMSHCKLAEPELYERVLRLYRRGMNLEPESYPRAAEYAQTFYLVQPARPAEGQAAWEHAFKLAEDDDQRDEVRTHLARYAINAGHPRIARCYLVQVSDPRLDPVKESLLRRTNEISRPEKAVPAAQ